jgi:hypothetical protein
MGCTQPFTFLGPTTYVHHTGERLWGLVHRAMPMDVFKVAGGGGVRISLSSDGEMKSRDGQAHADEEPTASRRFTYHRL